MVFFRVVKVNGCKKEVSLVKGQLTVARIQNIGFLTLIYPKCTTAKSKLAVKATALVKNEI